MEHKAQYYWDKVKERYFDDKGFSLSEMLEIAQKTLSKDEFLHLKEILEV